MPGDDNKQGDASGLKVERQGIAEGILENELGGEGAGDLGAAVLRRGSGWSSLTSTLAPKSEISRVAEAEMRRLAGFMSR